MSIYLTKFETTAAYEAAESSFILPNVSLITENNKVEYNPLQPVPPTPSHDFVEIGGVKWATMNIGANSITDTGLYFQWADTQGYTAAQVGEGEGKKYFGWEDYKYCDGTCYNMTKYNETDGKTVLDAEDDAVTAAWGGNWRMPTPEEYQLLCEATEDTKIWTDNYQGSGVAGLVCTDSNDNSKVLFFPTAGFCKDGNISSIGIEYAEYLTCHSDSVSMYCYAFLDDDGDLYCGNYGTYRSDGCLVRGVLDE